LETGGSDTVAQRRWSWSCVEQSNRVTVGISIKNMWVGCIESVHRISTKQKPFSKHQSGNRKKHSTETLNIAVTDSLLEAMDNKQLPVMILLDISKAFDIVRHDILLNKILFLGAFPSVHTRFESFLSDWYQYVRIEMTSSATAPLTHGILQGSVLSPFLFNIYTDSLPSIPKSCCLESYVHDSKTYQSFPISNIDCSLSVIEEDLQRVFEWCCHNSLLINPEKTKMFLKY
jgi:hypothetical protein